jgi:23S rRNA pseudouridine1911/1915/1917 synthase
VQPDSLTRLLVAPHHDGLRLDQYLAEATLLSRRQARRLISEGLVWRNGSALRVQSRQLSCADVIDVLQAGKELGCPSRPQTLPVSILHEDRWLVIADKPAGALSQPAASAPDELAFDQQLLLFLAAREGRRPYLRLVHRLDRQTSGTILFARHSQALPPLTRAWQQGEVKRVYLAVVAGTPERTEIELSDAIGRDQSHAWRFMVRPDGKPARTRVQVLEVHPGGTALVACTLETGRTHQVRVHLSAAGLPVLGDRLYGCPPVPDVRRPLLHAAYLGLPHPHSKELIEVVSPPPDDLAPFIDHRLDLALARDLCGGRP